MSASSGGCGRPDRPTVVRLLRETIVQLCRANSPFGGGRVEVDGIICITGSGSGQELVVKVHEVLHDPVEPACTGRGPPYSGGLFDRDRYGGRDPASSAADPVELKRRRLDVTDSLPMMSLAASAGLATPHHSAIYDYLSRFGLASGSSPRIGAEMDNLLAVKDLSLKSTSAARRPDRAAADGRSSPGRHTASPGAVDPATDTSTDRELMGARPARAPLPVYVERWSPNQPIPAIPQCFVCGLRFSSAEALGEHNETVHSIFTCLCCFKTFTSRSNLERHSRLHTGHRPYACPVCAKTFSRKDHLSNHATKHAYKCGTCTRRCADQTALADHYRVEHPGLVLAAVCAYCNKGFSSVELYEEHVKVHPQFHASAAAGENAANQVPRAGPPAPPRHQCQMCGFEAMDRVCLVQHQQLMHFTPMSLLARDAFDSQPATIQRHTYRCVVCPFTAATWLALRQHEATHVCPTPAHAAFELASRQFPPPLTSSLEPPDGQQVECNHCGHLFDSYTTLCQHLRDLSCHTGDSFLISEQHRDKRKQKQPKPVMVPSADEDEEVNVVSPESGNGKKSEEECSTERQLSDIDVKHSLDGSSLSSPDDAPPEIRMQPIRSIMNRACMPTSTKLRAHESSPSLPCLRQLCDDAVGSGTLPPPRLFDSSIPDADNDANPSVVHDLSNNSSGSVPYFAPDRSPFIHSSPDDFATSNNNNNNGDCKEREGSISVKSETQWMSSSLEELTRCVVCGQECADFTEMESHCLSEHSRSPCMYCPKTFAQKANRDRHMCLHTGDRPYGCPECGERFGRGDKLKMHRVRTHGVLYSLFGSRGKERDAATGGPSSRNHSTSQSPMALDSDAMPAIPAVPAAVLNGAGQDAADSPLTSAAGDSELEGSASVLSGGEWIDLRIGVCRDSSSKLHLGIAQTFTEPFPNREITDDEVANGQQV